MNGCCVDSACNEKTCMDLPDGETCGVCVSWRRCNAFGFSSNKQRRDCDFFPRKFRRAERNGEKT